MIQVLVAQYIKTISIGDIIEIRNESGEIIYGYSYDSFGNHELYDYTNSQSNIYDRKFVELNSFRYRGYYYDQESELYYLINRYYDPETHRFLTIDSFEYLDIESISGIDLYAYCGNNPVMYVDPEGTFWDTIFDVLFIGLDIYNLCINEGWNKWENWVALGLDLAFAAIPFITGGGGQVIKLADVVDDLSDFYKVTVIGETTERVKIVSQFVNATDNIYDGFKAYKRLEKIGKGGKVLAEVGGKASNIAWLYGKLRSGYKVIDIGIDSTRLMRSSSYIVEKIVVGIWKTRNIWKWFYHLNFGGKQ